MLAFALTLIVSLDVSGAGSLAAAVLQHLTKEDLSKMYFSDFRILDINGVPCFFTPAGYICCFLDIVSVIDHFDLAKAILEKSEGKVRLIGLGARDSLRLEAGLCLYGNDMEQHITPVEAGLTWAIGPPPRSHSEIQDEKGQNIGEVTSGGFSPCLKKNIAMGYVKSGLHKAGTNVKIFIRGKSYDGSVTKWPFLPTKILQVDGGVHRIKLDGKNTERRENGELFEMKVGLQLRRSLQQLRELATSSSGKGKEEKEEFASELF
ncbi:unnamed protein product [Fraxinus pennsylvanica]|uniref:Uncharacterized protein n=1 Tax=Fraxinus pennsylvanica TaxID=56036 RepID=A0AAD2EDP1_9LAMI|nr:unnamed protein product [Fraxinus pennsylvanica]